MNIDTATQTFTDYSLKSLPFLHKTFHYPHFIALGLLPIFWGFIWTAFTLLGSFISLLGSLVNYAAASEGSTGPRMALSFRLNYSNSITITNPTGT